MFPSEEEMVIKYMPNFKFETSISFELLFTEFITILPLISEMETESKLLVVDWRINLFWAGFG